MDAQTETKAPPERTAFSITEFCFRNGISPTLYHKLKNAGHGPDEMRLNTVIRITLASERRWQEARTNPHGTEAAAQASARTIASERGRKAGKLAVQSPRHVGNVKRATRARG
jgi:hypothetical protein